MRNIWIILGVIAATFVFNHFMNPWGPHGNRGQWKGDERILETSCGFCDGIRRWFA